MSLNDRMYYLAQALTSAKSAASLGSEDVEFTSNLQERIDVAQVQSEVGRAIASHKEMVPEEKHEALNQLDSKLLGLDDVSNLIQQFRRCRAHLVLMLCQMYQTYARPFRLYEPILLILKTADTRVEDVCEAVWRQLLREQPGQGYDAMKDAVMRDRLGDLIRRYYPSEAAPLGMSPPECSFQYSHRVRHRLAGHLRGVVVNVAKHRRRMGHDCPAGRWRRAAGCLGNDCGSLRAGKLTDP